jgi:hypothetical protein
MAAAAGIGAGAESGPSSSSASQYADTIGEIAACDNEIPGQVGIIQRSA